MRKKIKVNIIINNIEFLDTQNAINFVNKLTKLKIDKTAFNVYIKRGKLPPPDFKFKGLNFFNPEILRKWIEKNFNIKKDDESKDFLTNFHYKRKKNFKPYAR